MDMTDNLLENRRIGHFFYIKNFYMRIKICCLTYL